MISMTAMVIVFVLILFLGNCRVTFNIYYDWTSGIYPDTKWCGAGNNANGYNDLGSINLVDYCCRDHDNCAVSLEAGESGFGLVNLWFHTRWGVCIWYGIDSSRTNYEWKAGKY